MAVFEVRQCTNSGCGLRLPVDRETHCGNFCPKCGASMDCVETIQDCLTSESEIDTQSRDMVVLLDNIRSVQNVGSIFRTADGAGIKHIYLCGITPTPADNPTIGKTALGSERSVPWSSQLNAVELARQLIADGYSLLVLERTSEAVPIFQYRDHEAAGHKPLALILGNERSGVDPGLIELGEIVLALPMVGQKASLNVAVAFGVAVYWLAFT